MVLGHHHQRPPQCAPFPRLGVWMRAARRAVILGPIAPIAGLSAFAEVVMRRKVRMVGMKMTLRSSMRMMKRRSILRRMTRRITLRKMTRRITLRKMTRRSTLRRMTRRSIIRKMTVRKCTMLVPFARKETPEVRTSGVVVETREAAGGADTAIGDVGAKIKLLRLCRFYRQILLLYRQILLLHRSHSRSWCR